MGNTTIPTTEEQRDELRKLKEQYNTTYKEVIAELLRLAKENDIQPKVSINRKNAGRTETGRCDNLVMELLESHVDDEERIETAASFASDAFDEGVLLERQPKSIAAGADYVAAEILNMDVTQKEICEIYGTTGVTVRDVKKEILEAKGFPRSYR